MRAHNELECLDAAGRPLLAEADSLVTADAEDRILKRILAVDRSAAVVHRRRRVVLVLVGVAVLVAAGIGASVARHRGSAPPTQPLGHQLALSGPKIQLAGYKFKTPAGFKASASSCLSAPVPGQPRPAIDGFAAAASADGGCLEAVYLIADQPLGSSTDAQSVDVGQYHGYFVSQTQSASGQSSLFVDLPKAGGDQHHVSLLLLSQGLTEDELIAVAESGLPTLPPTGPTETTGTEAGG